MIFSGVASSGLFLHANTAHASLTSFISSILFSSANSEGISEIKTNSQNIEILEPKRSLDPFQGNGEIAIVGGTALTAETDLSGENIFFPQTDQISVYVVRKGDTISQVAKMYGVSVNTILWANDIKSTVLTEGQTLTILPISGVRHTVKKGETIQGIVKQHGGDLDEVLQFNALSIDTKLAIGDEIMIPNGEVTVVATAKAPSNTPTKTPAPSKTVPEYSGYYQRPISGGRRTQGIHGYNGVDLASPTGTPVVAAATGKVIVAKNSGWNGGYGKYIVISHSNGTQTLYAHLNQGNVSVGQQVNKGQVIGTVGSTGNSSGPHVHFEIRGAKNPF